MKIWKKVVAAMTAGMLCLGSVGLSGVENVLKSVGTVLSASAEETAETERVPVGTGTTTVRVGTGTTQLEYQAFDDDTVEITDCDNEAAGELEIPAEIDGKPVTSIGDGAFSVCSGLTKITIPNGVTSIGDYAFSDCSGLTKITIPNGVTSIRDGAFSNCSGLTEITIPDSVTSIGDNAFSDCSGLTEITIPDSVTSIRAGAFS
ncbi:leucine-rich repeat domain-containing protein, partial [Ruminococcus callidus]